MNHSQSLPHPFICLRQSSLHLPTGFLNYIYNRFQDTHPSCSPCVLAGRTICEPWQRMRWRSGGFWTTPGTKQTSIKTVVSTYRHAKNMSMDSVRRNPRQKTICRGRCWPTEKTELTPLTGHDTLSTESDVEEHLDFHRLIVGDDLKVCASVCCVGGPPRHVGRVRDDKEASVFALLREDNLCRWHLQQGLFNNFSFENVCISWDCKWVRRKSSL